ncbi:PepSY domain-containing protein [Skermanella mucosa]|uniref:PepSY domain-containing protein n=1 Tax=Skermanella mucosa TaxID=1789672 RepID=UPI001E49B0E2|nr:PepSY domain-containing protein [Skermanella mucosa]UEM18574.1 PepSY domain-containing protein [Skermanella mucosa]
MFKRTSACIAALVMAATVPAFAQQQGGSPAAGPDRSDLQQYIQKRSGPEQRKLELLQTTLLNQFGGLGFAKLVEFGKVGASYVAEVETVRGDNVFVTIDPVTGEIIGIEPITAAVVPAPSSASGASGSGSSGSGSSGSGQRNAQRTASGGGTSEYSDMGTCQPAGWQQITDGIDKLPPDRELIARRKMMQVWEDYADGDSIACREKLQDIQRYLKTASAR